MSDVSSLNGFIIYNSFVSGYENLLRHKSRLNDINVFPVADGDTGNNMVSTFYSTVHAPVVSRSVSKTMNRIADRALSGARGNSGIIVAQFLNSLAAECAERETMNTREFGSALRVAAATTHQAVENPKEGTLITVLNVWAEEMFRLAHALHDFRDVFVQSLAAAQTALERTTGQLEALRRANVVDAGASGLVSFLEGVARMIVSGTVPRTRPSLASDDIFLGESSHDTLEADEDLPFRYCAEALILRRSIGVSPEVPGATQDPLRSSLAALGDSLIVSHGREKTKVHIHTNDPARAFFELRPAGKILEQKVDDMVLQRASSHHPVSQIAIVTDSIADIPADLLSRHQIHVINQKILWAGDEYLDRLTISPETFYPYLDVRSDYPTSSVPDPLRVEQVFAWLAAHYRSILAIPVGKALSGTWQVMETAAAKLRASGYPVTVVDSRLNSAAQGLAVLSAAEDAERGLSQEEIVDRLSRTIEGARIYVSVAGFRSMVRGGRISPLKGFIASMINVLPIVTLDPRGKGVAFGASFSQEGCRKKIMKSLAANRDTISRYAVVHAAVPERAAAWALELETLLGQKCEYIMEISPVVGIHAGVGAMAVAYI